MRYGILTAATLALVCASASAFADEDSTTSNPHPFRYGFGMDLGVPSGVSLGFVFHPKTDAISLEASFTENVLSPGGRLSLQLDPLALLPTISFPLPTLPTLPAEAQSVLAGQSFTIPPVSKTTSFDFSGTLSKISDISSSVSAGIDQLNLDNSDGEFSWLDNISVSMQSTTLPSIPLATYQAVSPGAQLNLLSSLEATPDQVLSYFKSGPVTLTITLGSATGTVVNGSTVELLQRLNGQLSTNLSVCVSASASVSKSL